MAEEPNPVRRKRHKTTPPPLSVREIRFCQLYADTGKGYSSYLAAGYPEKGTRAATDKTVFRLVRKREIREYVRELQTQAADAAMTTANRLVQGLSWVAFADRTTIFKGSGKLLPIKEWPKEVRSIISGIEIDGKTGDISVKFERSTEAKKILAQILKMIGKDTAADGEKGSKPLVVGGEADPDAL